jgi:hypothetical protein
VFIFVAFSLISIFMCACLVFSLSLWKAAKQIPSGLKSKISYTPEDGHVGRNMQCEHPQQNARPSTTKLHEDGNLT